MSVALGAVTMDATCDRELLLRQLQVVEKGTSKRSSIQVLAGIRIAAHDGELHLAATDMEMSVRTRVAADIATEGVVVAPGKKLLEIVRSLGGEQVHLRLAEGLLVIESDGAKYEQNVFNADDFPQLPPTAGSLFSLDRDALLDTVHAVSRAASTDESRPVLTGVKVQISAEKLTMVATDSYRLSVQETEIQTDLPEPVEAIIPARALNELVRIADASAAAAIAIGVESGQVLFGIDETWITARRIEGQFPNHQQLIPQAFEHEAVIDRAELLEVVNRARVMAERNPLRLAFSAGQLTVSAATQDIGSAEESLPIRYEGEDLTIGFNADYLRDGVQSFADDTITLQLISPLRPGLISGQDTSLLYLIMPVRLPE
ncbi:MAG: DNA polymerase III subunit beta [Thermoleophilia bacterium]|nr:DNA polymerase III subunit beta [Thermoleophilia bacterium]